MLYRERKKSEISNEVRLVFLNETSKEIWLLCKVIATFFGACRSDDLFILTAIVDIQDHKKLKEVYKHKGRSFCIDYESFVPLCDVI